MQLHSQPLLRRSVERGLRWRAVTAPDAYPGLVDFAVEAARRAGDLTLEWYQRPDLAVKRKTDGTPVTGADTEAERMLRGLIGDRFPDDPVLGEEGGFQGGAPTGSGRRPRTADGEGGDLQGGPPSGPGRDGRLWVIDPIDGTKAFAQGVPLFSNLVALIDEHGPAVGVINLPALGECVWAGRGLGAWWNGEPCRVSPRQRLGGSCVCTSGFSYWPDAALKRLLSAGARVRTWGDAYGYALVATGRAEAMIDPECSDWDVAPMAVILAEAGGRFTDRAGAPGWRNGSGVASNGHLHDEVLALFD